MDVKSLLSLYFQSGKVKVRAVSSFMFLRGSLAFLGRFRVIFFVVLTLFVGPSCSGRPFQGCKVLAQKHPYVPYSLESAPTRSNSSPGGALKEKVTPPLSSSSLVLANADGDRSTLAPENSSAWFFDGLHLVAPQAQVFMLGMVRDFDEDGKKDAFAITTLEANHKAVFLLFFHGLDNNQVDSAQVVQHPPEVQTDTTCSPIAKIEGAGTFGVLVELGASCIHESEWWRAKTYNRWMGVVSVEKKMARVRIQWRVKDFLKPPYLSFSAQSPDVDQDGTPDLLLRVTMDRQLVDRQPGETGGASAPQDRQGDFAKKDKVSEQETSLAFSWVKRPEGLSKESSEPASGIKMIRDEVERKAAKLKSAPSALEKLGLINELAWLLCGDKGAVDWGLERSSVCDPIRGIFSFWSSEYTAYLTLSDPIRALSAIIKGAATGQKLSTLQLKTLRASFSKIVPLLQVKDVFPISASLPSWGPNLSWGPFYFDDHDKLIVQAQDGPIEVDLLTGKPSTEEIAGPRYFLPVKDAAQNEFGPIRPHCLGSIAWACSLPSFPRAEPISQRGSQVELLLMGSPLWIDQQTGEIKNAELESHKSTFGSLRSSNGEWLVVASPLGVLVRGQIKEKSKLWTFDKYDPTFWHHCAVSGDAKHIACANGKEGIVAHSPSP